MKKRNIPVSWPHVLDEDATLDAIIGGKSIARYGDGELKICIGGNCISQVYNENLAKELRSILKNPAKDCIVATIRNVDSPKNWFWKNIIERRKYIDLHSREITYYSQWITRPDSAPWIDRKDFWEKMFSLWRNKDVILVAGSHRSLTKEKLSLARSVELVECMYRDTYQIIDKLEEKCLSLPQKTVLLCCGATATVLANRLSQKGKHALDLGHLGMFDKWYGKFDFT